MLLFVVVDVEVVVVVVVDVEVVVVVVVDVGWRQPLRRSPNS